MLFNTYFQNDKYEANDWNIIVIYLKNTSDKRHGIISHVKINNCLHTPICFEMLNKLEKIFIKLHLKLKKSNSHERYGWESYKQYQGRLWCLIWFVWFIRRYYFDFHVCSMKLCWENNWIRVVCLFWKKYANLNFRWQFSWCCIFI